MSNNMITNTMRYGFDSFELNKVALITAKQSWNCVNANEVNGFSITKTIPASCEFRIAFTYDNKVYKLGVTEATEITDGKLNTVLANGNTVEELEALTSLPYLIGKNITPIIAITLPPDSETYPIINIKLKTKSNQDQFSKVVYSNEYTISEDSQGMMYDFKLSTTCTNGGSVVVEACLKQAGVWSEYMALSAAKNKQATAIKFKATYTATTLGISVAKINNLFIYCRSNTNVILGTQANIITKTQDFGTGMLYARLLVKHNALIDARVKAYISFSETTLKRDNIHIATGTGDTQTIQLADSRIDHSSIKLFFNLQRNLDFDYNSETNKITFLAPINSDVTASYTYGLEVEDWKEMQFGSTQKYGNTNYHSSDFTYEVPAGTSKGVSAIKIALEKPYGSSVDLPLGTATGRQQMFVLAHYILPETLVVKSNGSVISRDCYSYDDASKILTLTARKDSSLTYDGQWQAETPVVKGFVCAWNE